MDRGQYRENNGWRRAIAARSDQRGSSFVQVLLILVILGFGGILAIRALSAGIDSKSRCTGEAIANLSLGSGPCSDGPAGPGGSLPTPPNGAAQTPGQGQDPGNGGQGDGNGGQANGNGNDQGNGGQGNGNGGQANGNGNSQSGQPGAQPNNPDSGFKAGANGNGKAFNNGRQANGDRNFGGAPPKSQEDRDKAAKKTGAKGDAEVGVEKKLFGAEGALGETTFAGGSEKLSGGFAKADGTAFAKASLKEGAAVGAKVEGKASVVNLQGKHELPGGIQESHEVDVLSVKGKLEGKAGVSKDVVGATVSGEAGANIAEAKVDGKKVFKIPFTDVGLEIGGNGSASAGANIGGEATAGYFKGDDGKHRLGLKAGFKAALGLGLGGKLSLNVVW